MEDKELIQKIANLFKTMAINKLEGNHNNITAYRIDEENEIVFNIDGNTNIISSIIINNRFLSLDYVKLNNDNEIKEGIKTLKRYIKEREEKEQETLRNILKEVL